MAHPEDSPKAKLERDGLTKLHAARHWKAMNELDFKECYFFAAPWRQRQINSTSGPTQQRLMDAQELNTDQAFIIVGDFVTEIVNTFLPEALPWCERGAGMFIPDKIWDQIKDRVKEDDKQIFKAIKASNFYSEIPKAFYPDLAIGTCGLWIDQPHPSRPIQTLAIPLRELEVNLGPEGDIDDRFVVRYPRNSYVRALLGEEIWDKLSSEQKQEVDEKPTARRQLVWGFWRHWHRYDDECWQHVVYFGNDLVHDTELKGEGCCPLLTPRFNPSSDWPHGYGPLLQGLPSYRQIDELETMRTQNTELSIVPPIAYPADSIFSAEQGFEPGMAYPIRPEEAAAIKNIYTPPPPNAANFQYEEKLRTLRKLHFVDHPEQTGDTPPTLGQWLDELARAQRRIGTPGMPFWREGPARIFLRYKYLLEAAGVIAPIKVDGRSVATLPYNPTQRAAEQQEIATAVQALQIAAQTFPEEFRMVIDGKLTMVALFEKMRVLGLVKIRKPEEVQAMVAQIAQLIEGRQRAGQAETPAAAGQPGPV